MGNLRSETIVITWNMLTMENRECVQECQTNTEEPSVSLFKENQKIPNFSISIDIFVLGVHEMWINTAAPPSVIGW